MLSHLYFEKIIGLISKVERTTSTHVDVTGGRKGTVTSYGSIEIEPVKVNVTQKTMMDIYVETSGGEKFYKLVDVDIPLREGHNVTIITAQNKNLRPLAIGIKNHTLGTSDMTMSSGTYIALLSLNNVLQFLWRAVLIVAAIFVGGGVADYNRATKKYGILIFILIFILSTIPFVSYYTKIKRSFKHKVNSML